MSLICAECSDVMGPSETLPGRDGVMVHPVLLALVWKIVSDMNKWDFAHVRTEYALALCFECISKKTPGSRKNFLERVYEAIVFETSLRMLEEESHGKWLRMGEGLDAEISARRKAYLEASSCIDREHCLLCGNVSESLNQPHFIAKSFDRAFCRQITSGFPGERNYTISYHLPEGGSGFTFCFSCLNTQFHHLSLMFSSDLAGAKLPPESQPKNELVVTESFMKHIVCQPDASEILKQLKEMGASIVSDFPREQE